MSNPSTSEPNHNEIVVGGEAKPRARLDSVRSQPQAKRAARSWIITLSDKAAAALTVENL